MPLLVSNCQPPPLTENLRLAQLLDPCLALLLGPLVQLVAQPVRERQLDGQRAVHPRIGEVGRGMCRVGDECNDLVVDLEEGELELVLFDRFLASALSHRTRPLTYGMISERSLGSCAALGALMSSCLRFSAMKMICTSAAFAVVPTRWSVSQTRPHDRSVRFGPSIVGGMWSSTSTAYPGVRRCSPR